MSETEKYVPVQAPPPTSFQASTAQRCHNLKITDKKLVLLSLNKGESESS